MSDEKRHLLRHTVATLGYRADKALANLSPDFADFRISPSTRTPVEILTHLGDLIDWANNLVRGDYRGQNSKPLPWDEELSRFRQELQRLDQYLASDAPLNFPVERLFQGPIADALSHIGQIAMLRGMAGNSLPAENYSKAKIEPGTFQDQAR